MTQLINRIQEGGPVFMVPLLLIILMIILLFVLGVLGKKDILHTNQLIGHLSLFGMIWGFLGSTIGLISTFDSFEAIGEISQPMFSEGLKITLLTTLYGLVTFLIGRLTIFILTIKLQNK